jgi:hypothetical protein
MNLMKIKEGAEEGVGHCNFDQAPNDVTHLLIADLHGTDHTVNRVGQQVPCSTDRRCLCIRCPTSEATIQIEIVSN